MKSAKGSAGIFPLLIASVLWVAATAPGAHGQEAQLGETDDNAAPLLQQMAGTWDVQQRMWFGVGVEAIELLPAVARRRLVEGAYLEEVMELAQESEQDSFTRTTYINYNVVRRQYEYFSIDSRAPQQMSYESEKRDKGDTGPLRLEGGSFVAAQWGEAKNVPFKYRLTIGKIENNQQVVQLYLTSKDDQDGKEFRAFEYVYTRQR